MKITIEFESLDEFNAFMDGKKAAKTPTIGSGLDDRTVQCLLAERISTVEDAQAMSDSELLKVPNLGRKSLAAVRAWRPRATSPLPTPEDLK